MIARLCAAVLFLATFMPSAFAQQMRFFNHSTNQWEESGPAPSPGILLNDPSAGEPQQDATLFPPAPTDYAATAPVRVRLSTPQAPGTVIVDTERRLLFLVEANGFAMRYPVGVGREGFGFSGEVKVGRKAEWPDWVPPAEMRERERANGRELPVRLSGGADNPLGARALYLYRDGQDTLFRIHGTNQPWTVGQRTSSGCIRMRNEDVEQLYAQVPMGGKVVVIGPDGRGRGTVYRES